MRGFSAGIDLTALDHENRPFDDKVSKSNTGSVAADCCLTHTQPVHLVTVEQLDMAFDDTADHRPMTVCSSNLNNERASALVKFCAHHFEQLAKREFLLSQNEWAEFHFEMGAAR